MIHEEEFDEMGNTIGARDTIPSKAAQEYALLDQKHLEY